MSDSRGNGRDEGAPPAEDEGAAAPREGAEEGASSDEGASSETGASSEAGLAPVGEAPPGDEVESLRRERDELRDQLLRRRAEFENYRRRVERDRQQAGFEAAAAVFRDLVGTLDNLERALASGAGPDALREGVELTYRELLALLSGQGVEVHDPAGQPFDPQRHQALIHEAAAGYADGTVVQVLRKGYSYKDRLLRPALVKVAKGPAGDEGTEGSGGIH